MVVISPSYVDCSPFARNRDWFLHNPLYYSNRFRPLSYFDSSSLAYKPKGRNLHRSEYITSDISTEGIDIPITRSDGSMTKHFNGDVEEKEMGVSNLDFFFDVDDLSDEDSESSTEPWIPRLFLDMRDKEDLISGRILSDKHILAAQKLLKEQFPHIGGLQDTCLSQTGFVRVKTESIQIHHIRGNHWVVSSSLGGRVVVYDSIYNTINAELQTQLNDIYVSCAKDGDGNVIAEMAPIPRQRGSRDCGLFCIAIAYELCCGNEISETVFNQKDMRQHLLHCFDDELLRPFNKL